MRRWFGFGTALGIDLGSSNVLVYQQGRGIVLREPAIVAVQRSDESLVAIGQDAWQMLGRTPGNIVAVSPLKSGVIANYSIARALMRHLLNRVCGHGRFIHPDVAVCLPCAATDVERRALLDAVHDAGARRVYPLLTPMAAAIGAQLPVTAPRGHLVVDIGGGTTDIGVMALGGVVVSGAARCGGEQLDDAIMRYIKREHGLVIGERMAEEIKVQIGAAIPDDAALVMDVRGRDIVDGLPRTSRLHTRDIANVFEEPLLAMCMRIRQVLEQTPPELAADILEYGMVLTGGGALLRHIAYFITQQTHVPAVVAADSLSCAALGAGRYLESLRRYDGAWTMTATSVLEGRLP